MGKEGKKAKSGAPRSSTEFNKLVLSKENLTRVVGQTSDGSHLTFRIIGRNPDEPSEIVTIPQSRRDMKDENPKVYYKLTKQLKRLGFLVLILAGSGIALERIATGAYSQGGIESNH